ncbi:MAG: ABC transporter substrate-binding protein, partial [Acutalibacteraceae bacterium]
AIISPLAGCYKSDEAYIYFELPSKPATIDPQTAKTDSELLIVKNIFEGLMRKDSNGQTVTGIAQSVEKNGLVYTFKLRNNAKWNNGDKVTAHDFAFAFKRALLPETKAPFASRLYCIKNAEAVHAGSKSADALGITVIDDKTLKIELSYDDARFLDNLTTSVAMPCNQKFFNESAGKYGLFRENIVGNGSYRLAKWSKDTFGIRLYRNEHYTGDFVAKNAAVFLTCDTKKSVVEKLKGNSIDMSFIDSSARKEMESLGFKTVELQNICWVMTMNGDLSKNMRKALMKLVGSEKYIKNLPDGYSRATSIYPAILGTNFSSDGIEAYDLEGGKNLYQTEVLKLADRKFPSNITLYYYENGTVKPMITDILGHWQSNLSAFVKLESASSPEVLLPELKNQTLSMAVFPIRADSENPAEYLVNFGISYKGGDLSKIQKQLLEGKNILPIAFQNTMICYSPAIKEIFTIKGDGFIDFSFIVKKK